MPHRLVIVFFLISTSAFARVHNYETTRLKSTGGTGVGSLLLDESAVLNPAPIAFFTRSSFYVQKINADYNTEENALEQDYSEADDTLGFLVADAKGSLKGSVGYTLQEEGADRRRRISATMAKPFGKKSSFGVTYRNTKDVNNIAEELIEDKYNQVVLGVSHAVNENFTAGAIVVDPFKSKKEDNRFTIGFQYVYKNFVTFMADGGSDYNDELSKNLFYSGALQLNVFKDFYGRVGTFHNKYLKEKGNGVGLSWVGPRLSLDIAMKNIKPFGISTSEIPYNSKVRETAFSLAYLF